MSIVQVHTPTQEYKIIIKTNALQELPAFLKNQHYSQKGLLVTDSNVQPLYSSKVVELAKEAGINLTTAIIPAGENSKSLTQAEELFSSAITAGLDRRSPIIALGGGVVGDIAGFIAATYMRGVPFIQIPTSLLAQVDSSVGGKVAVNHRLGKNLIGAFYQPDIVLIDLHCLETLPQRELATGLGEVVKYGLIYDRDFYNFLQAHTKEITNMDLDILAKIITRCCEIKACVVNADEKELGLRAILNFGHTLAHSIETETKYQVYNHGEAVAIGMMAAMYISHLRKYITTEELLALSQLLTELNLPTKLDSSLELASDKLYQNLFHDKKTVNGTITWILLSAIGKYVITKDVTATEMKQAIDFIY